MKKLFFSILTISAFAISAVIINGCDNAEGLTDNITVPVPISIPANFDAEIPFAITDTIEYVKSPEIPMNLNIEDSIKVKYPSLTIDNLKAAHINTFSIAYNSSENDTKLNVIRNANLYIKTPELEEKLIATAENNTSETQINFVPVENTDITDYLKSTEKSLILEVQGAETAEDLMNLNIDAVFGVEVGL